MTRPTFPAKNWCLVCSGSRYVLDGACAVCGTPIGFKERPAKQERPALAEPLALWQEPSSEPSVQTTPYPHSGGPTSRAAAESQDDSVTATQREKIVRYLCEHGDATRDEMEAALDISGDAMRPRCRALEDEGWIEARVGVKRETRKGREAQVYQPTDRLWRWWKRTDTQQEAAA